MRALLLLTALALGALATGCDRTVEDIPDTGGRRDAPIADDVGTDTPSGDDGGIDAGIDDAGDRDAPAVDGGIDCEDPSGCWACAPTEPDHFLNGCTDSSCEPFAVNTTTLPRLNADGTLPPLP